MLLSALSCLKFLQSYGNWMSTDVSLMSTTNWICKVKNPLICLIFLCIYNQLCYHGHLEVLIFVDLVSYSTWSILGKMKTVVRTLGLYCCFSYPVTGIYRPYEKRTKRHLHCQHKNYEVSTLSCCAVFFFTTLILKLKQFCTIKQLFCLNCLQ